MPPSRDDRAYVFDMLRYSRIAVQLVHGRSLEDFKTEYEFRFAVERVIEIIGQAARNVSDEFEQSHPEIPRQKIVAQRHVLAHEYGDIVPEKLWHVATIRIAQLIDLLEPLVPPPPPDPEPESRD